ncbi:MORN repeat-containing protein 3 isoform X2 [Echeneis naucrates]|uniref:MORN repeat-containing protein 3 isoform X2 n=1 Tax=Echeneis naucrates TaxID=173247 RepID=UPI001113D3F4|nr:MORN repeat-containing protein 3 isoform X2 [Echeneis naucrates]
MPKNTPKKSTILDNKSQKCGLRHTVFSVHGDEYNGEWRDNKKHGKGLQLWKKSGATYNGKWKNGKRDGYGEWSEGLRSGWGRMYYESGDTYEGEWMKDKNHGQGIIRFANGDWYEGNWQDGKRSGNGKYYYSDKGQLYEGFWVNGVAKCGTLSDFGREEAPSPTMYPIPQVCLVNMQLVLEEARLAHRHQCC